MKVLVLATDYPMPGGNESHRYIHVRNKYYQEHGIDVTVLNFEAKERYVYDEINVIDFKTYNKDKRNYDVLISHQPNLREHFLFFIRKQGAFPRIILFFHGHEVLKFSKAYPKPYKYVSNSKMKTLTQDLYDDFKLFVWRNYIPRILHKAHLVFVSEWMHDQFIRFTGIPEDRIKGKYSITYNCVGKMFETNEYEYQEGKKYDFITIRGVLDGSKYCIDIVNQLAFHNPKMSFHIIGKGAYFNHNKKAPNVTLDLEHLDHAAIIRELQNARCALMPTRTDAQGLMTCEMATFGMPVITSDIPVCHEALDGFENVSMITNEDYNINLENIVERLEKGLPYKKNTRFFNSNTSKFEVELINSLQ